MVLPMAVGALGDVEEGVHAHFVVGLLDDLGRARRFQGEGQLGSSQEAMVQGIQFSTPPG
jgi:hypothetical protein